MKKITYYCDRCSKQITGDVFQLGTFYGDQGVPEDGWDIERGAELCRECYDIIDDAVMAAIRMISKPESKQKKTAKKDIDMGKVKALRKAGWTLEKIGDEFSVSAQTIANHITAYEAAHAGEEEP